MAGETRRGTPPVGRAAPGQVRWTGVLRRTRRSGLQGSAREHLAVIDHLYGPMRTFAYVIPLCGADAGKAGRPDIGGRCQRCEAIAAGRRQNERIEAIESRLGRTVGL